MRCIEWRYFQGLSDLNYPTPPFSTFCVAFQLSAPSGKTVYQMRRRSGDGRTVRTSSVTVLSLVGWGFLTPP